MKSLFLALLPLTLQAQTFDPLTSPAAELNAGFNFGSETSTGQDVEWNSYGLLTPISPTWNPSDSLSVNFLLNYRSTQFDSLNGLVGTEETFHSLALPAIALYQPSDSPWGGFLEISPQLNSDLEHINSDAFSVLTKVAIIYKYSETLSFHLGYGATRKFGAEKSFPAAGFIWSPSKNLNVSLIGADLTASYRVTDSLIFRAGGYTSGGVWNVETANGQSLDQGLSSYSAGLGVDYKITDAIWLSIWGGATLSNELFSYQGGSDSELSSEELDEGLFGFIGLKIFEW